MPRLLRDLAGAEPVDSHGVAIGPPITLPAEAEFDITIRKMNRPSDSFDEVWCEIAVANKLYRVPLKLLQTANFA
jgi:hypothetical protein